MRLKGVTLAVVFLFLAALTVVTDPDHFTTQDLFDIGHVHHEHLVVFLVVLAMLALFLPAFVIPGPILYTILAGAGLVVTIGMIDLFTGWT